MISCTWFTNRFNHYFVPAHRTQVYLTSCAGKTIAAFPRKVTLMESKSARRAYDWFQLPGFHFNRFITLAKAKMITSVKIMAGPDGIFSNDEMTRPRKVPKNAKRTE